MSKKFGTLCVVLVVLGCAVSGCKKKGDGLTSAGDSISADSLSKNTQILASDEFEGRFPASKGEEKTVTFLESEFKKLGLQPGNGDSFFQDVPMVEIAADPKMKLMIAKGPKSNGFEFGKEFVAGTKRVLSEVSLNLSDMVFIGYGIVAPEFNWNDYEGLDVRGKTVVTLINDPGFATKDPNLFHGNAMTYYGRWTYKFEEAARRGASGVLIIHETEPAAYGWQVVQNGWSGSQFSLAAADDNLSRCAVEGWVHLDTAQKIFEMAGKNFGELKAAAAKHGFKAVPLGLKASLVIKNTVRRSMSRNVIAVLPGKARPDECVIYVSHWDHFGIDPKLAGDKIYNGAQDNATGTAGLIELGRAFKKLKTPPARSIVFMAVTGEEQGLLGSTYYATHPIFPAVKTAAAINMDALNVLGKMRDVTVVGFGNSELDAYVESAALEQGRQVRPDSNPERGGYFRSDHFSFAKEGIPAIYIASGIDHVRNGKEWAQEQRNKYLAEKYHKPTDEFDPNWDLSGAIDDLRLMFNVGTKLGLDSTFPNWKEGTEFKAKRDAKMAAAVK